MPALTAPIAWVQLTDSTNYVHSNAGIQAALLDDTESAFGGYVDPLIEDGLGICVAWPTGRDRRAIIAGTHATGWLSGMDGTGRDQAGEPVHTNILTESEMVRRLGERGQAHIGRLIDAGWTRLRRGVKWWGVYTGPPAIDAYARVKDQTKAVENDTQLVRAWNCASLCDVEGFLSPDSPQALVRKVLQGLGIECGSELGYRKLPSVAGWLDGAKYAINTAADWAKIIASPDQWYPPQVLREHGITPLYFANGGTPIEQRIADGVRLASHGIVPMIEMIDIPSPRRRVFVSQIESILRGDTP